MADDIVARVGEVVLSLDELQSELHRRGTAVDAVSVIEEWTRFQSTLAQARAAGYDRDPRLQAQWERLVVSQYQEEMLGRQQEPPPSSEAEQRAYYEVHAGQYAVAEAVRLAVLHLRASVKAAPDQRRELTVQAEALRDQAGRLDARGFTELIRQRSDDQATRYQGGDIGWLTNRTTANHWEGPVIEAGWQLRQAGDVSPVIPTETGFYIVRLSERRPASPRPFEEVRDAVRYHLQQQQVRDRHEQFVRQMRLGLDIEVNQRLVDSLAQPATVPPKPVPALPGG